MNFDNKYLLEDVAFDGYVKTFRAAQISSGQRVMVHLLEQGHSDVSRVGFLQKIKSLRSNLALAASPERLEIGICKGITYVVTDVLDPSTNFEGWVDGRWEQARNEAKRRWKADVIRTLVSGNYQSGFEQAGHALAAFPEDEELHNTERVAHLLWQAREGTGRQESAEMEGSDDSHRVEWLRKQIAEIESNAEAPQTDPEERPQIENEREKFSLWCYATALRLHGDGNTDGASAVAGQGLACYRGQIDVPQQPATDVAPVEVPETRSAWEFFLGPLGQVGQKVSVAMATARERWQAAPPASPPGAFVQGPWAPVLSGLAVATMLMTIGWLVWSLRSGPGVDQATPAMAQRQVRIESSPSGATILINGEECGTSTCDLELPPGLYQAQAQMPGYSPSGDVFQILDQESTNIRLALRPLAPVIRLFSDLANSRVSLDGQPAGQMIDGVWEHELTGLAFGKHVLTISDLGSEATIQFETRPGAPPRVLGPVETHNLQAAFVAGLGSQAEIYGDAAITQAFLDDGTAGQIRSGAVAFDQLTAGTHEVTLASGQNRQTLFFDSGPQPTLVGFVQADRSYGALRITTGEDAVNIYLNGHKYRRATRNGELLVYLYPDQYTVWVEKDGFRSPPAQAVAIRKGQRAQLGFSLSPIHDSLLLVGNAVPGSEIALDGSQAATVGLEGGVTLNAPPGASPAVLRRQQPQVRLANRSFDGRRGAAADREGLGELHLAITPSGADVHLTLRGEGESVERVITDRVLTLAEGRYTLRATAPGHHTAIAKVRLTSNQITATTLELQPRPQPTFKLADWETQEGWTREGTQLVRRGGDFVLSPVDPQAGTYEFGAFLQKGSRLEWIVNYIDENNYALYQLGREYLYRIQVTDGHKSAPHKIVHTLDPASLIRVRVEVSQDSIVHKLFQHGEWSVADRWKHTGARFARGSFGFYVPSRSQIGLRNFTFVPSS